MLFARISCLALLAVLAACGGGGGAAPPPPAAGERAIAAAAVSAPVSATPLLVALDEIVTIGSTVDPRNGDVNPYGLDVARATSGVVTAGDLVVCNFNDAANVQGAGSTIVALHPHPGARPVHVARQPELLGCDAVAAAPNGHLWSAAFASNDTSIVGSDGALISTLYGGPWRHPFGITFAAHGAPDGGIAYYESNAQDGSIVRIAIDAAHKAHFAIIATGFAVNGGAPGSILGPSGLQYDDAHDRLYIVDGADNSLTAVEHVSRVPANGIAAHGATFGRPSGAFAHRVFAGAPLNGPISSALMPGGHVIVGNTLDPAGTNLMVELTPDGRVVAKRNVDAGAAGAIFGMVATGRTPADARLYFNDDNDNTVKVLMP